MLGHGDTEVGGEQMTTGRPAPAAGMPREDRASSYDSTSARLCVVNAHPRRAEYHSARHHPFRSAMRISEGWERSGKQAYPLSASAARSGRASSRLAVVLVGRIFLGVVARGRPRHELFDTLIQPLQLIERLRGLSSSDYRSAVLPAPPAALPSPLDPLCVPALRCQSGARLLCHIAGDGLNRAQIWIREHERNRNPLKRGAPRAAGASFDPFDGGPVELGGRGELPLRHSGALP